MRTHPSRLSWFLAAVLGVLVALATPAFAGSFNKTSSGSGGISGGGGGGISRSSGSSVRSVRKTVDLEEKGEEQEEEEESSSSSDDDDSDEDSEEGEERSGARTLGKSCMYGADGSVIYAPAGRSCGQANAAQAAVPAKAAPEKKPSSGGSGTCILGGNGEVLYAPPGASCGR